MNKTSYIILLIFILIITGGCVGNQKQSPETSRDSIYTVAHIQDLSIAQPHEAIALLDTAEQKKRMTPFDISRLRCLVYHNGLSNYRRALTHGLEAYGMPESRKDPELFLNLLELIADEYHTGGDYAESVRYCSEGLNMARQSGNRTAEANFHITFGLNLLVMRQPDEAFGHFRLATDILKGEADGSSGYAAWDDYVYALGMTINSLCDEKRYDGAIALLPDYEKAVGGLEQCTDAPEGLADMRRASGYAAYAYIYRLKGDVTEADRLYGLLCRTRWASAPDGEQIRIPYLLASRRYRDALHYIQREKHYWQETADTVSHDYIEYHLQHELEAYEGIGNLSSAYRVQHIMLALKDTLRNRERREDALELAEVYKTNEQAALLKEHESTIRIRTIIFSFTALLLAVAVGFIIRILRDKRVIQKKNKAMTGTIDELMTYKNELFIRREENIRLRDELQQFHHTQCRTNADTEYTQEPDSAQEESESGPTLELTENDRVLYDRLCHEIVSRKLYLNPDFNKSELMKEIHVPAYKFASLFKKFAGCSFSQYVQDCRMDYAISLMREHPQWSMEAVAREAQMSKTSFYRQFQKKYGMNPSSYIEKELFTPPFIKQLIFKTLRIECNFLGHLM